MPNEKIGVNYGLVARKDPSGQPIIIAYCLRGGEAGSRCDGFRAAIFWRAVEMSRKVLDMKYEQHVREKHR